MLGFVPQPNLRYYLESFVPQTVSLRVNRHKLIVYGTVHGHNVQLILKWTIIKHAQIIWDNYSGQTSKARPE